MRAQPHLQTYLLGLGVLSGFLDYSDIVDIRILNLYYNKTVEKSRMYIGNFFERMTDGNAKNLME